jgi:hypothetical protein
MVMHRRLFMRARSNDLLHGRRARPSELATLRSNQSARAAGLSTLAGLHLYVNRLQTLATQGPLLGHSPRIEKVST